MSEDMRDKRFLKLCVRKDSDVSARDLILIEILREVSVLICNNSHDVVNLDKLIDKFDHVIEEKTLTRYYE
jgi:hypothetical protein